MFGTWLMLCSILEHNLISLYWKPLALINGATLFFFTEEDDQGVYPLKTCKCKLSLIIFSYSCCHFIISLISTQRFWAFSCYLQCAGGGRNSSGSLIPQVCIPSLSFAFCFHIDLLLRGFFAHFPTLWPIASCVLGTVNAFSLVLFFLLALLPSPTAPLLQETTFWTLSLAFHKSLLAHFFQTALRDISHPVPSLTECPF